MSVNFLVQRSLTYFFVLILVATATALFILKKANEAITEIDHLGNIYALSLRESSGGAPSSLPAGVDRSQADIGEWKTYRNEEYGFEVRYPDTHAVEDETLKNRYQNRVLLLSICKINTEDCEGALIDVFGGSVPKEFQEPNIVRTKALERGGYFFQFLGDEKIFSTFKFIK